MSNNIKSLNKTLNKTLNTQINQKSINLTNKSGFYEKDSTHIFSNVYLIAFSFVIALSFIGYTIYTYLQINTNSIILDNSSYFGSDMINFQPIFKQSEKTIDDCLNVCKQNIICGGITYNSDDQTCIGSKSNENGGDSKIRSEAPNFSAWIKPISYQLASSDMGKNFKKGIILGYTKTMTVIDGTKLSSPYQLGFFCYSFNLTIYDFNKNFGNWRHIFHKGSQISTGASLDYQSWENLILNYPNQCIGVWLAPFTNNLRIAVTTSTLSSTGYGSFDQAFDEICDDSECYTSDINGHTWKQENNLGDGSSPKTTIDTNLEYIDLDLQNIPLNTQINITFNFRGKYVDTIVNGKIKKTTTLQGIPKFNTSAIYVMNNKTFGGEISNLFYYPGSLLMNEVNTVMSYEPPPLVS